ncbi:MAG: cytochrome c oxidase subunit II [Chloroflexota bacterium]
MVALAGVAMAALSGCSVDPQTTLAPQSEFADQIQFLLKLTFFMGVGVFVVVEGVLVYVLVRYRRRRGRENEMPVQVHGNNRLEITWTIIPTILLAVIAFFTTQTIFTTEAPPPASAMKVTVVGHQWWWEFQYPTLGITTADEVHMPVNKTVSFTLESADVMHSFWLPRLGGKRDVIPNHRNNLWWTPNTIGVTPGQCGQYCGTSHANMHLLGVVQSQADFNTWVAGQKAPPATPAPGTAAAAGLATFKTEPCIGCHTIQGVSSGTIGPNLTHLASRSIIAGGILKNNPHDLAAWLHNPPGEKPGSIMPNLHLTNQQITDLVAYLTTLK